MKQDGRHRDEWKLTPDIKTGFTVPENYFRDIESNVIMRLKEDKLPKNHGFITPKKYFEKLDNHIIEKTKTKKGKLMTLNRIKIKFISVAASIALLLFFGFVGIFLSIMLLFFRIYKKAKKVQDFEKYLIFYLLVNLVKSDSFLYHQSFSFYMFLFHITTESFLDFKKNKSFEVRY